MSEKKFHVFIGWDSRQEIAFEVCKASILERTSIPIEVHALKQQELRSLGLYWRELDPLASTEFTYTRFLVCELMNFEGWALFVDSDFLFTSDIAELVRMIDDKYALMCVQHNYHPKETIKMDNRVQTDYPRKNWSSLILWNCSHPSNRILNKDVVNREVGAFLHRFKWLEDSLIGDIPKEWNWLEGWYPVTEEPPKAIHYTRGGPWYENWQHVDYANLWLNELKRIRVIANE